MTWIVHIHDSAAKQLKAIPPDRRQCVLDDIGVLEANPLSHPRDDPENPD
jgi:mRNA-degrading endonuclease RelE of RelBE toxin-antitoxin system